MDDSVKKFLKNAQSIRLEKAEREEIRQNIQSFVGVKSQDVRLNKSESHNIRRHIADFIRQERLAKNAYTRPRLSVFTLADSWTRTFYGIFPRTFAVACLFLLLGAGVSFAAESAIPGDALYPLKVKVLEPIKTSMTFSPEARAVWETERASRRLKEVEKLFVENHMDPAVLMQLDEEFSLQVNRAHERIVTVEKKGNTAAAAELAHDLDRYVKAHSSIKESTALGDMATGTKDAIIRAVEKPVMEPATFGSNKFDNNKNEPNDAQAVMKEPADAFFASGSSVGKPNDKQEKKDDKKNTLEIKGNLQSEIHSDPSPASQPAEEPDAIENAVNNLWQDLPGSLD